MKAVIEQWSRLHNLGIPGQWMRSSPYFLEHVVQRMNDEDLQAALSLARQDDFHDFEMWSYYRALAQVIHKLPADQFEAVTESLVNSVLRNDAGYDATSGVIQAVASRLTLAQAQKLIERLSDSRYSDSWLLREQLISSLGIAISGQLVSQQMSDFQPAQSLNQGQLLAELALNIPVQSAGLVAEQLHQSTRHIFDLPKRFEMLESLRIRNRKETRHWQSRIREQALQEVQQASVPAKYKLDILKFLPFYSRVKVMYQLFNLPLMQQQPLNRYTQLLLVGYSLIDSIRLRRIIFTLLIPFTALFARFTRTYSMAHRLIDQGQGESLSALAKLCLKFMEGPSPKMRRRGGLNSDLWDWDNRIDLQPNPQKVSSYVAYLQKCKDFITDALSQLTEGLHKAFLLLLWAYMKLHGWCMEVPQTAAITMWLFDRVVPAQQLLEDKKDNLAEMLQEDQEVQLPNISSILQNYLGPDSEIDHSALMDIFQQIDLPFGSVAHRITLRKRGANLWADLPDDKLDLALDAAFNVSDPDDRIKGVLTLLPSLGARRRDLLPKVRTKVEEESYWRLPIWVPASLAYYLPEREQKAMIVYGLECANRHRDEAEFLSGRILDEVVDYADEALLAWVAKQLVEFHRFPSLDQTYFAAIKRMAFRINNNMLLLDIIWPLVTKMNPGQRQVFFLIIAPDLEATYVAKVLSVLIKEERQEELTSIYLALRERWLKLMDDSYHDSYIVRTRVLPEIGRQSRNSFFATMLMFSKIILKLGSSKTIATIGDDILEVSRWRWF